MTLQEALRLLDIVTDVNEQYSKQERIRAAMRLEELLRLLLPEEYYQSSPARRNPRGAFSCPFPKV